MKRREFLDTLCTGSLALIAAHRAPSWNGSWPGVGGPRRKYWAWIPTNHRASGETWKRQFGIMREAGVNAILPEIYDGRRAYYASTHLPVGRPWLEEILPLARAEDLETHAWMWSMPCNIKNIRQEHPEWFVVNRRGESAVEKPAYVDYYRFLCPSHPEVHEFLKTTVAELCTYESLDGIHLDYIRYPDVILPEALQARYGLKQDREYPEFDYCYCNLCRSDFRDEHGTDPLQLDDPSSNATWRQFRYDRITRLVNNTLVPVARAHGKSITAAVFPDWAHVRQQWPVWDLDAVLPMLYHTLYKKSVDWIRQETERAIHSRKTSAQLFSGILVFGLTQEELMHAVEAALLAGADGVAVFHAMAMSADHWMAFRRATQAG